MSRLRRFRHPIKGRTPSQRVATYTRVCMYVLLALGPYTTLAAVGLTVADEPALAVPGVALFVASVAVLVTCVILLRRGITHYLGGPKPRVRVVVSTGVALVVATVLAVVVLPARVENATFFDGDWRGTVISFFLTSVALAFSPLFLYRWLLLMSIGVAAASTAATLPAPYGEDVDFTAGLMVGTFVAIFMIVAIYTGSGRLSVWMLGVVSELERTRAAHARLAVAEERLRFSRDMHDVFGRALSAVAVKSELAAELADRGKPGAAEEMREVCLLARSSLQEMREVVGGYRTTDLAAELAGARSVLRSAGIDVRLQGTETQVGPAVQEPLAWVVREGVTNVIRHSDATWCTVRLTVTKRRVSVEIVNDGARPAGPRGSGLTGLGERLASLGGEVTTWAEEDRFGLSAAVPQPPATEQEPP